MLNEYDSIITTALEASFINTPLSNKYNEFSIIKDIDTLTDNIIKSWAPLKATIVSIIAKIKYPEWDTRKHQIQIGGKYSLRTIDKCYVSKLLYKYGLYDTPTEFALTRSFEKAEPFTKSYSGKISPQECKVAFLNIVEIINTLNDKELLYELLTYLLFFLKNRKETNTKLRTSQVISSKNLEMIDISKMLNDIQRLGSGSSVVPVIITHTLLSIIQPHLWIGVSIKPLKEHTSPDSHSQSYGDIEAIDNNSKTKIAIEIKHKIAIDDTIITIFDRKTRYEDIPLKYILTTANTEKRIVENNICVDTMKSFVISYLQLGIFYEKTICSLFVKELRLRLLNYNNLRISIKEQLNNIITSLLVVPSLL